MNIPVPYIFGPLSMKEVIVTESFRNRSQIKDYFLLEKKSLSNASFAKRFGMIDFFFHIIFERTSSRTIKR